MGRFRHQASHNPVRRGKFSSPNRRGRIGQQLLTQLVLLQDGVEALALDQVEASLIDQDVEQGIGLGLRQRGRRPRFVKGQESHTQAGSEPSHLALGAVYDYGALHTAADFVHGVEYGAIVPHLRGTLFPKKSCRVLRCQSDSPLRANAVMACAPVTRPST